MKVRHWVVTAVCVACGGAITTVDGNKDVGSLNQTDKDQLCHDVVNYIETTISPTDLKKFVCGFSSVSTDPATCQANYTKCLNDPSKNVSFSSMINCQGFETYLLNCSGVTVSQFSDCYKQYVNVLKTYAAKMPLCTQAAQQQAAADAVNQISSQCLQTIIKCSNTNPTGPMMPPPMYDAGSPVYDAGVYDAGSSDN